MNDIGITILSVCGVVAILVAIYMGLENLRTGMGVPALIGTTGAVALIYSLVSAVHRKNKGK